MKWGAGPIAARARPPQSPPIDLDGVLWGHSPQTSIEFCGSAARGAMRHRSGGPFLFGAFSGADAMFAPVINRLDVYDIAVDDDTRSYMAVRQAHPAWIEWKEAALAEPWIVPADEA